MGVPQIWSKSRKRLAPTAVPPKNHAHVERVLERGVWGAVAVRGWVLWGARWGVLLTASPKPLQVQVWVRAGGAIAKIITVKASLAGQQLWVEVHRIRKEVSG